MCVCEKTLTMLRMSPDIVPTDSEQYATVFNLDDTTTEEVQEADLQYPEWLSWYQNMQHEMFSLLLSKVDWAKEPAASAGSSATNRLSTTVMKMWAGCSALPAVSS